MTKKRIKEKMRKNKNYFVLVLPKRPETKNPFGSGWESLEKSEKRFGRGFCRVKEMNISRNPKEAGRGWVV